MSGATRCAIWCRVVHWCPAHREYPRCVLLRGHSHIGCEARHFVLPKLMSWLVGGLPGTPHASLPEGPAWPDGGVGVLPIGLRRTGIRIRGSRPLGRLHTRFAWVNLAEKGEAGRAVRADIRPAEARILRMLGTSPPCRALCRAAQCTMPLTSGRTQQMGEGLVEWPDGTAALPFRREAAEICRRLPPPVPTFVAAFCVILLLSIDARNVQSTALNALMRS